MGHLNAALEWLVQVFNDVWPLVMATFIGAWLAFQHIRHYERRKDMIARASAGQFVSFVLSSQGARLDSLKKNHLDPHRQHPRRAVLIERSVMPENYPRLDLPSLPTIFDKGHVTLMNEVIEAEQNFFELGRLFKERDQQLTVLDTLIETGDEGKQQRASARKVVNSTVDHIYELTDRLTKTKASLFERLEKYVNTLPTEQPGDLVDYLAWIILSIACATVGVFFFSHWAVSAGTSAKLGLDISLVSSLVFALSLYFSLGLCLVVATMCLYALAKKLASFSIYFWTFLISLQPAVFLFWLDIS